jgi:hypothetical protein
MGREVAMSKRTIQVHYVMVVDLDVEELPDGTVKITGDTRPWMDVEMEVNPHGDTWDPDEEEDRITSGWREATEDEWQAGLMVLEADREALDHLQAIIRAPQWDNDTLDDMARIVQAVRPEQFPIRETCGECGEISPECANPEHTPYGRCGDCCDDCRDARQVGPGFTIVTDDQGDE